MRPTDLLPPLPAAAPPALHAARAAMVAEGFAYYREGPHGAPVVIPNVHGATVRAPDARGLSDR